MAGSCWPKRFDPGVGGLVLDCAHLALGVVPHQAPVSLDRPVYRRRFASARLKPLSQKAVLLSLLLKLTLPGVVKEACQSHVPLFGNCIQPDAFSVPYLHSDHSGGNSYHWRLCNDLDIGVVVVVAVIFVADYKERQGYPVPVSHKVGHVRMDTSVPTPDVQMNHLGILGAEDDTDLVRCIDCQRRNPRLALDVSMAGNRISCRIEGRSRIGKASHLLTRTVLPCLGLEGGRGGKDEYRDMDLPCRDLGIGHYDRVDRIRDANLVVLRKDTTAPEVDRQWNCHRLKYV